MPNYNVGNVEVGIATQADASLKSLTQAANKCNTVAKSLEKINTKLKQTGTASDNAAKSSEKMNKKLSQTLSLNRIYFLYNYTKRMAQGIADIIQTSIDYQETLNKFQNSMGNMYNDAVKFQNKITEAYSLSSNSLVEYQANFNNMLKGLGQVDESVTYSLSEALVEMGVDISSLYNTTVDEAMTKLQAALAQQTRPIRSVAGFDITQNTLGTVMQSIGITDRSVSQLSQVEKRLLIIIALQQQMANTNTFGDWARTMNQPANQLRILNEQLTELKSVLGSFVVGSLSKVLPVVNGIVMALKELLKTLASIMGIDMSFPDTYGTFDIELGDEADEAATGLDNAAKSAEKLKKATTGIDELNILSQDTSDSGTDDTGSTGGISGGVDSRLLSALGEYKSQLDGVDNKARDIRDKIMGWLGFTKQVDDETGEVSWKLNDGYTNIEKIRDALIVIGATLTVGAIAKGIVKIEKFFKTIKKASGILSKLFTGIFGKQLGANIAGIGEGIDAWVGGAGTFGEVFTVYFLPAIQTLGGIALTVGGIVLAFSGLHKLLDDDITNDFDGIMQIIEGIALTIGGIAVILGAWPLAIIAGIVLVGALIVQYWDEIKAFLTELGNKVKTFFTETLPNFFTELGNKVKTFLTETLPYYVGYAIGYAVGKVKTFFTETLPNFFAELPQKIKTLASNIGKILINAIIAPFKKAWKIVKKMVSFFKSGFSAGQEAAIESELSNITGYATGGFPTRGDYFLANENGKPEYVGSIGGRTAVANQNQIIQGISYGVSMANSEQNMLLRAQNELLRQLLAKGNDVYLNGRKVTDVLNQTANARGTNPLSGGFSYV